MAISAAWLEANIMVYVMCVCAQNNNKSRCARKLPAMAAHGTEGKAIPRRQPHTALCGEYNSSDHTSCSFHSSSCNFSAARDQPALSLLSSLYERRYAQASLLAWGYRQRVQLHGGGSHGWLRSRFALT